MLDIVRNFLGSADATTNAFLFTEVSFFVLALVIHVVASFRSLYRIRSAASLISMVRAAARTEGSFEPGLHQLGRANMIVETGPAGKLGPRRIHDRIAFHTLPGVLQPPLTTPVQHAPGLLTAIGILGTFFGLTSGLQRLGADVRAQTVEGLLASIDGLVGGMTTAFVTSIGGMFFAGTLLAAFLVTNASLRALHAIIVARFEKVAVVVSATALLAGGDSEARRASEAQVQAAAALERTVQKLEGALDGFRAEAIGRIVGAEVREAIADGMSAPFNQMAGSLRAIEERMREQNKHLLQDLLAEMRDQVIAPLAQKVEASSEATRGAAAAVTRLNEELGGITTQLAGAVITIQRFQEHTLSDLNAFQVALHETLREFREETTGVLRQVSFEVSGTVRSAGEAAAAMMDKARSDLETSFSNIDRTMARVREVVETQLDRFRIEYQARLTEFFAAQNELLEGSLGEQRRGLAEVVERLDATFRDEYARRKELSLDLADALEQMRLSSAEIQALLEAVGASTGASHIQLQEVARSLKYTLSGVEGRYRDLDTQIRSSLEQSNGALTRYLEHAQSTYARAFEQFDQGAAAILGNVAAAANQAVEVAHQLRVDRSVS